MKSFYLTLVALFLVIGCAPKDSAVTDKGTTGSSPEPGKTTGDTQVKDPEPPKADAPKLPLSSLPASVKTDAFEYYGLGNEKAMDAELKSPEMATKTGGVTISLNKVEGDKAYFTIARTGAIAGDLGDDMVMADSNGVYMNGTSIGTVTPSTFLALPADLTPGKTWKQKTKVVRNSGEEIAEDSVYKVVGMSDVKTKSGMQKALLVTSTGTAVVSLGGRKESPKYETKSWYVKGVGQVKVEISLTSPGKPTRTLTVEQSN